MKRWNSTLLLGCALMASGCNRSTEPTPANTAVSTAETGSNRSDLDHNTADAAHDHSVAGHSHGAGPHGGTIADWGGGKYHIEFVVDHETQQATTYVLGSDEKTPSPVGAESIELSISNPEMLITLQAAPQEGDPAGTASRFIGTHEKLGIVQEYSGTITGLIDGTPYSGDFAEEAHSSHTH